MNEIRILVRTQNSAKAGFEEINKQLDEFGKKSSETFSKSFNENLSRTFTTHINEAITRSEASIGQTGDRIGNTVGERISTRITERIRNVFSRDRDVINGARSSSTSSSSRSSSDGGGGGDRDRVHVDVDIDKQSLLQRLGSLGSAIQQKVSGFFGDGIKTGIGSVFSGDILSTVIKGGLVTLGATVLAPVLGAAITSGVLLALGGGAIGAGIAAAIQNSPTIQDAFKNLREKAKGVFADFGQSFQGPLFDFVQMASDLIDDLKPLIDDVGASLGPVADDLAHGVIGFLQNALPGIMRAIKESEPLIETLASELPGIGDAFGKFADHIGDAAPEAAIFFNDLLNFIELAIVALGAFIEANARVYVYVRYAFLTMVNIVATWAEAITSAAAIAFGWVPGLGPKLDTAAHKAAEFKQKVNRELQGIDHNVDISVRIKTFGLNTAVTLLDVTRQLRALGAIGRAAGGAVGQAASGGPRSNMTWVGEQGPELVDLAPGSRVHTAGDSARMASGGGGGGLVAVARVDRSQANSQDLIDAIMRVLRIEIFNVAGGDVQQGLGS